MPLKNREGGNKQFSGLEAEISDIKGWGDGFK